MDRTEIFLFIFYHFLFDKLFTYTGSENNLQKLKEAGKSMNIENHVYIPKKWKSIEQSVLFSGRTSFMNCSFGKIHHCNTDSAGNILYKKIFHPVNKITKAGCWLINILKLDLGRNSFYEKFYRRSKSRRTLRLFPTRMQGKRH